MNQDECNTYDYQSRTCINQQSTTSWSIQLNWHAPPVEKHSSPNLVTVHEKWHSGDESSQFQFQHASQSEREREKRKEVLTLTSALLQGGALGVLSRLGLPVFGQLSQRVRLSLLVLFALAAVMAALRFPVRSLPPLLLLSAWRGGRLLSVVVEDILLLLEEREVFILGWWNLNSTFVALKKI